ncbi:hypothetical protein KSU16_16295 [Escherichia coli]|uniref:hypothetical protein n=1 Tax=Escherichia coli TaxID=562 RepID=UPI0021D3626C|nr:hypothetical protein [Escherichia coli]MCU6343564.1 hypothetical protein [Escherichia coli]
MMKVAHGRVLVLAGGILPASAGAYGHEAEGMFAKQLSLQVSEDISASGLRGGGDRYRKLSIPWHSGCLSETERVCAGVMARGSYMDVKSDMGTGICFTRKHMVCRWGETEP